MHDIAEAQPRRLRTRELVRSWTMLIAVFALSLIAAGRIGPAVADGGLETQKGGLFHRKGWIAPDIYRRKEEVHKKVAALTPPRSATASPSRKRTAAKRTRAAKPRLPKNAVRKRERRIARSGTPKTGAKQATRVASLTTNLPASKSSKPARSAVTGGSGRISWVASSGCVPQRLRAAINYVARNFGRVRVNSTCRSRRRNRRVGGASRSFHLLGRAADFRVFGNIRAAARYLRSLAGGYKHYGGGLFHIDTGPKRTW